jgi:hypothetical protein
MAVTVGYGPLARIDGPPPLAQEFGLIAAAEGPAAGIRLIPEADEHWGNGAEVYPYPTSPGDTYQSCAPASEIVEKDTGGDLPHPKFESITAYVPDSCTSYSIGSDTALIDRAATVLDAVESAIVAHEIKTGLRYRNNPHFSDGNGTFPNANTATGIVDAVGIIEAELGRLRRVGVIHLSPQAAIRLSSTGGAALDGSSGVMRTVTGTPVVVDQGYAEKATPYGHPAPTATQEWIYATGPIDIRRGQVFTTPGTLAEALDRGRNEIVFRAERLFLVIWDTAIQISVLADICSTTCTRA